MFSFAKKLVDRLEGVNAHEPDTYFKNTLSKNNGYGLRVLNVESESSASKHGFESWFDYIVGIADHDLPVKQISHNSHNYLINEDGSFNYGVIPLSEQSQMVDFDMIAQELASIANSPNPNVNMEVWNAKGGVIRTISLPLISLTNKDEPKTLAQSATLKLNTNFNSLGLTVQSQHMNSATFVWKVLNTQQALPAFRALLVPHSDYIIGCDSAFPSDEHVHGLLSMGGENLLTRTIYSYYKTHLETLNDDKVPIILYVYNHEYDIVRKVTVHLSSSWSPGGNKGILGCDVGYGLLHRLPVVVGKFDNSLNVLTDEIYQNNEDYSYKFLDQPAPLTATAAPFNSSSFTGQGFVVSSTEQAPLPPPVTQPAPVPQSVKESLPLPPQHFSLEAIVPAPIPVAQAPFPETMAQAPVPPPIKQAPLPSSATQTLNEPPMDPILSHNSEEQAVGAATDNDETVSAEVPRIREKEAPLSEQESHDFFANLGEEKIDEPVMNSELEVEKQTVYPDQPVAKQNEGLPQKQSPVVLKTPSNISALEPLSLLSDPMDEFETIPLTEEIPLEAASEEASSQPAHAVSQAPLPKPYGVLSFPVSYQNPQIAGTQAPIPSSFQAQAPLPRQLENVAPQISTQNRNNSAAKSEYQPQNTQASPALYSAHSTPSVGSQPPPMVSGLPPYASSNSQAPPIIGQAPLFLPKSVGSLLPPAARPGRRRKHNPHVNLNALNDILNEELLKSKENDYRLDPSAAQKETANLPPPPRF